MTRRGGLRPGTDASDTSDVKQMETPTWSFWDHVTTRAWSRAGAVAAVVSNGTPRRVLTCGARWGMLVLGSLLIAVSVAVTLWTGLGPGPLDVFIGAVRNLTGVPLAVAVWTTVGAIIAVACMLGRRPGVGTFVSPFAIGPMLQASIAILESFGSPSSLPVRIALQVVAILGIGLGSGALIVSGLGAGSGELFAGAASDRAGQSEPPVRFVIEMSWIGFGVALGGPAGFGTLMVALLIGPAVAVGYRAVDGVVTRSVAGVANTHGAIVARRRHPVNS